MSAPNEQTQTYTKSRGIIDIGKQVGIDLELQADTLLDEAREADSEQSSLIDTSPWIPNIILRWRHRWMQSMTKLNA